MAAYVRLEGGRWCCNCVSQGLQSAVPILTESGCGGTYFLKGKEQGRTLAVLLGHTESSLCRSVFMTPCSHLFKCSIYEVLDILRFPVSPGSFWST